MLKVHDTNSDIIINHFEDMEIGYAFHDIDGTHSLIRDWPPVMSICLYDVIVNGVPEDFDSKENKKRLIEGCGTKVLPETDRFCVESAGLSALTQMEWAIRRAAEEGTVKINCDMATNSEIIKKSGTARKYLTNCLKLLKWLNCSQRKRQDFLNFIKWYLMAIVAIKTLKKQKKTLKVFGFPARLSL